MEEGRAAPDDGPCYAALVQAITEYAVCRLDPDGRIASWNRGGELIHGYAADEILGENFARFYPDEDAAAGEPARALRLAGERGRFTVEGWRLRKDGSRFWASVAIDAIRADDGALVGFAKVTRDISEHRAAQEALAATQEALTQAQKMEAVGQLTGGIAHDFNNLLTVVLGHLDLLAQRVDEAAARSSIDSARRAAERGAKLTEQLLAFARRQPLRPQVISVNDAIAGFDAILRHALGEAINLRFDLGAALWPARIDPAQFRSTLLNLVVNARDAMPGGGTIAIGTRNAELDAARAAHLREIEPGSYVEIAVRDTGHGMAPETLRRALEPFFTTKEVGEGSGLGLSQAYGFARQSGGQIEIESEVGKGTTVHLYLPRASGAPASLAAAESRAAPPRRGTALIVEDDPDVLDFAAAIFAELGYAVLTAHDGPEALALVESGLPIDLLFTDVVMPNGMSGVELARRARALRPGLRALLTSGYPKPALPPEATVDDDILFLGKPYRLPDLSKKLQLLGATG